MGVVARDPWLEPFENAIRGRHDHAMWMADHLTNGGKQKLSDFATGYLYYGLHKTDKGWVLREWAPNATEIY
ncbi:MAG: 1,4-alpha-glucan-branching enzyme, partial [Prevotella sp.]|nr:1,4-alpha-glucan-branching enzyme [Prevotella sp.]